MSFSVISVQAGVDAVDNSPSTSTLSISSTKRRAGHSGEKNVVKNNPHSETKKTSRKIIARLPQEQKIVGAIQESPRARENFGAGEFRMDVVDEIGMVDEKNVHFVHLREMNFTTPH